MEPSVVLFLNSTAVFQYHEKFFFTEIVFDGTLLFNDTFHIAFFIKFFVYFYAV